MKVLFSALVLCLSLQLQAQQVGLGFSFLFPRGGNFSAPVAPVSIRGVGLRSGPVFLETGLTWYRMSGLGVQGLPFNYDEALTEPFNSFLIPLNIGLEIGGRDVKFLPRIGGFFAVNAHYTPREGAFSKGFSKLRTDFDLVWTETSLEQNNTFGLLAGVESVIRIRDGLGLRLGVNYYLGRSALNPSGNYTALLRDGTVERGTFEFPDTDLDYSGWELMIGISIKR